MNFFHFSYFGVHVHVEFEQRNILLPTKTKNLLIFREKNRIVHVNLISRAPHLLRKNKFIFILSKLFQQF